MFSSLLLFVFIRGSLEAINITQNHIKYSLENGKATVLGQDGNESLTNVVFPEYISYENSEYTVTTISNSAFRESTTISGTLNFPNSLEKVGDFAFYHCFGISGNLTIPDSVTSLGMYCFYNISISSITLSQQLTTISDSAFADCINIKTIPDLPQNLKELGSEAFYGCEKMTGNLSFPNGLEIIGRCSFMNCYSIICSIEIPDSVTSVGYAAFFSSGITSLKLSNNLKTIEDATFSYSHLAGKIEFPQEIESICANAFFQTNITEVVFLGNIKEFGDSCFYSTSISTIQIPQSVKVIPSKFLMSSSLTGKLKLPISTTEIQSYAFAYTAITSIEMPEELSIIGDYAFCGDSQLSGDFSSRVFTYIGADAFEGCSFETITQLNSMQIGKYAFYMNKKLTGVVTINTATVDESAFSFCPSINKIEITFKDYFIQKSQNYLPKMFAYGDTELLDFTIHTTVDFILYDELAFGFCSNLKYVNFPSTIQTIGEKCFYCCSSLPQNLRFTNYSSLIEIGQEAFYGCNAIVGEVAFPNSLKKIGERAFASLHITGSIYIPDSVEHLGDQCFFGCSELTGSIHIGNNCTYLGESAFSSCDNMCGSLYIGEKINNISAYAFYGCCNLSGSLTIQDGVEYIHEYAFMGCSGFTGILVLPIHLISIGAYAFASCSGLSGIFTIPSSVKYIGNSAFFGCSGFNEIHFLSSDVEVESFSFSRLSVQCFENVPELFYTNDPEIYSSDNFSGKIIPGSFLNLKFHCSSFHKFDTFVYVLSIIGTSGAFLTVVTFSFNTINLFYRNVQLLQTIFDTIIAKEKTKSEDEQRSVQNITNGINSYLLIDCKEKEDFRFTESQANKALKKSIDQQWPDLHIASKKYILNHSFNDISYRKSCSCSDKCHCKEKAEEFSDKDDQIYRKSLVTDEYI